MTTYAYSRLTHKSDHKAQEAFVEAGISESDCFHDDRAPLTQRAVLMTSLKKGDTVLVKHIIHLGTSVKDLKVTVGELFAKGVRITVLDTAMTPEDAEAAWTLMEAYTRELVAERTRLALKTGRSPGRPSKVKDPQALLTRYEAGESYSQLARAYKVSIATVGRTIRNARALNSH